MPLFNRPGNIATPNVSTYARKKLSEIQIQLKLFCNTPQRHIITRKLTLGIKLWVTFQDLLTYSISNPCQCYQCHNGSNEMNEWFLCPCFSTGIYSCINIIHGRNNFIAYFFKLLFFGSIPAVWSTDLYK